MHYMCRTTCVIQVYILYMCRNTAVCIAYTYVIHMFYTCNTTKMPHIYYRCDIIDHPVCLKKPTGFTIKFQQDKLLQLFLVSLLCK